MNPNYVHCHFIQPDIPFYLRYAWFDMYGTYLFVLQIGKN